MVLQFFHVLVIMKRGVSGARTRGGQGIGAGGDRAPLRGGADRGASEAVEARAQAGRGARLGAREGTGGGRLGGQGRLE